MPTRPIHQNRGVGVAGNMLADLIEMQLHGMCVDPRQHETRADASGRADGAEQIGILVALICRLTWPGSLPGPLAHLTVLLADTSFVLEPDFHRLVARQMAYVDLERVGEVFLYASRTLAFWAGCRGLALMWLKPMATSSLEMVRSL